MKEFKYNVHEVLNVLSLLNMRGNITEHRILNDICSYTNSVMQTYYCYKLKRKLC